MKTITICIGNSDDKLGQSKWADYIRHINEALWVNHTEIQFSGFSAPEAKWQNAAWVCVIHSEEQLANIKKRLTTIRQQYNQDSIAIVEGVTEFL